MGEITIKVRVPDRFEEIFKREVEELAKALIEKERLFEKLRELKGILETDKPWKELKREIYEQSSY
ncbi:hypothetical protein Asulf_01254 [Archaeoglobus sulfaticallidus PM70-1]|uniref:Uncharacterized protein n=1 Tax=Archaeoglobus sulfaticallidus PM70-1 TaxID=387631 RepID=N0BLW8_9EURY|nr:hypothetical protein [Archaeoglobus sulfaticallidus]AGK61250.1 hypothetical protein Asulf_01254 [Archaeoglobus sulfaticallidus PM70-1]